MPIPYDKKTPHRFDVVGSFLRPEKLRATRARFEAGEIDYAELKAVEDEAILDLVAKQKAAGLGVITDGEFRRATWHLDFMWGFDGIDHAPTENPLPFHDEPAYIDDTYLTGKLGYSGGHPFIEHFKFVQALEDDKCVAKLTIPAPAQFWEQFSLPVYQKWTAPIYPKLDDLKDDIVAVYTAFIQELFDAGCRNLQLDDCSWGIVVDEHGPDIFGTTKEGLQDVCNTLLELNNRVIDAAPKGLTINTHVCRGNFHSTWACSGSYEDVASTLLAQEYVYSFFLEFDDDRSGGFEPLAQVPEGKGVVLGLITSKSATLENKEQVIKRIHEAAQYVPLKNLALSPQCGFASCEIGNKLTEDEQWAKIALVKEIAEEVWG